MLKFLHIACGSLTRSRTTREFDSGDWEEVRMDANPGVHPDIVASWRDMQVVESDSFDAVFTAHSLERLYPHEVGPALAQILRILKDDGYFVVTCADIQSACALVAQDKLLEPAYESAAGPVAPIDILYGFRPALAAGYERHACKCGFTSRSLLGTLAQAGFGTIWSARNAATFTLAALASKQARSEEFLKELAVRHFG
jgi:SAM-dependent methyltransferase